MELIESKTARRLFKTESGVEIKPSLLYKHSQTGTTSDQTYYYAWYYHDPKDRKWKVRTNHYLYGELKDMVVCKDREEAEKIAQAVNNFIHLLLQNI